MLLVNNSPSTDECHLSPLDLKFKHRADACWLYVKQLFLQPLVSLSFSVFISTGKLFLRR